MHAQPLDVPSNNALQHTIFIRVVVAVKFPFFS
jgi:hypothetical protein